MTVSAGPSPFATVDDLATLLNRTFTPGEEDQAALLLDMATAVIRSWTRQDISAVIDDTIKLPGTWSTDLELPQWPVTAVHSVAVNGLSIDNTGWTWNSRQLIRRGFLGPRAFDWPIGVFITESDLSDWPLQPGGIFHWSGPPATIEVVYDHGFATIPEDVIAICLSVAARSFVNPVGAVSESIGNYSITYDQTARNRSAGMALTPEDQQALRKYRKWWA